MFGLKEKDIIQLLKSGERDKALELLYKFVYPNVRKYALNHGATEEDARDLFQDSVMVFFQNLFAKKLVLTDTFNPGGYVMSIAKHKHIDKLRKDKNLQFVNEFSHFDEKKIENLNFEDKIHNQEVQNLVSQVLESVGERCASLLKMVMLYDMTLREVANKLEYSNEGSAKTQLFKCRQKLILKYKDNSHLKNLLKSVDE